MKPYSHLRKAEGYCCRMCDGPLSAFKKKMGKALRKFDRQQAKKLIRQSEENE